MNDFIKVFLIVLICISVVASLFSFVPNIKFSDLVYVSSFYSIEDSYLFLLITEVSAWSNIFSSYDIYHAQRVYTVTELDPDTKEAIAYSMYFETLVNSGMDSAPNDWDVVSPNRLVDTTHLFTVHSEDFYDHLYNQISSVAFSENGWNAYFHLNHDAEYLPTFNDGFSIEEFLDVIVSTIQLIVTVPSVLFYFVGIVLGLLSDCFDIIFTTFRAVFYLLGV